jgi:cytochrome c oxidase subunit 3
VNPSPWPFIASLGVFFLVTGLAFFMHRIFYGAFILLIGLLIITLTSYNWFRDICEEASFCGYHTLVVKKGLKSGFLLFILSEIMLFFGFFWAFFHSSVSPSIFIGNSWPYPGIDAIPVFDFPLFNTALLITSGISITWAHRGVAIGSYSNVIDSLIVTIFLGFLFVLLQGLEYYEATFNLDDSVFSCTFYMLTGLHGCHVIIGVTFIFFCFLRFLKGHFSTRHYLGFVFAIWYWHFVDIVWIILFLSVYGWGGW